MLVELMINNFALIKDLKLELTSGLNILSGETGAGKSIIIKALDMLLGGRASTEFIRFGEEQAIIEGVFNLESNSAAKSMVEELGFASDDTKLILTREISVNGNNKSRINGRVATLEMTRQITQYLIDIHGQHEHQSLLNPEDHLRLLDEYGSQKIGGLKEYLAEVYQNLQEKRRRFKKLDYDERERERRIDLLEFEVKEIEESDLKINEDKELMEEKKKLGNAEELSKVVSRGYAQLYESSFEDDAIIDKIRQMTKEITSLVEIDPNLEEIVDSLESIGYDLEDVSFRLRDYEDEIEFNPQRLNIVVERLKVINNLKRKYGDTINQILDYQQQISQELEELQNSQIEKEEVLIEVETLEQKYLQEAKKLSAKRREIAKNLEGKISNELKDLSMLQTQFKIKFEQTHLFSKNGIDKVEFLIAPNPGSDLKPLAKIASGGELSRIMLALKTITADIDQISTLIFDEIDTGIGGRVGNLVADKLSLLSTKHQLVCITHLPQIASVADSHYLIIKKVVDNNTETVIHRLTDNGRIRELARMLDGSLNDTTLDHARELLKSAIEKKGGFNRR